jgi:hypothetical protein
MRMIPCLALGVIFGCSMRAALARDVGQWETGDPAIREWYQSLMQPDMPSTEIRDSNSAGYR